MKEETNILLLSDMPPCKNNQKGEMLSQMVRSLLEEKVNVSCICVIENNLELDYYTDIQNNYDLMILSKPLEKLDKKNIQNKYYKKIKKLQKELIRFIKEKKISKIFCPLEGEVLTLLLEKAYSKLQIPYVVQISDNLEKWMEENDLKKERRTKTKEAYKIVLTNCQKCIVKSTKMSTDINKNVNITSTKIMYIDTQKNGEICLSKEKFLEALDIKFDKEITKLHILEVNNTDEAGRRFNGYDLIEEINNNTVHSAKQIVTVKNSKNKNVGSFFNNWKQISFEQEILKGEQNILSVHNQLSLTSDLLKNSDYFKNADLVHYHLIHNTKLSLYKMIELCSIKPTVLSLHDTWNFTGRCVTYEECDKWKTGCQNCQYLDTMFPFKQDNCNSLWKLKKKIYDKIDVDIIVSTPYMYNLVKESPLTQNFTHVHLIPFGLDLDRFKEFETKENIRAKLNINKDDIVLFFRAQKDFKGTEYIVEAMKKLNTDKKITLLSCSEKGLLKELEDKYTIIELGTINDDKMIEAYNACDIFLMPSKSESFGLMAIEAMACSRPVVVFNNTALPSVTFAPECGVLVENKNETKLMEAIEYLIDNEKERLRRGKLGRKLAEEHYDIKTYHKRILKVYEDSYKRQKSKREIAQNTNVDYTLKDVKKIDEKLSFIYKKLFNETNLPTFLHSKGDKYDEKYIIDYSNENVQNLISLFNEELSKRVKEISLDQEKKLTIRYSLHLLKNDRSNLVYRISKKIKKNRVIYNFTRKTYHSMKWIKRKIIPSKRKI